MAKTGLGRGLGSLLGTRQSTSQNNPIEEKPKTESATEDSEDLNVILVGKILPGAMQPRNSFNDEALNELADSIRENGIMPVSYTHLTLPTKA